MIDLPDDVTKWLTSVFRTCNYEAASKLTMVPNCHEPWIDFAIIENLQRVSAPYRFRSDWTVSIDTHWLGNAPLWPIDDPRWEIADIGFLVMFTTATELVRSKLALLQSKRLYADRQQPETEEELRRYYQHGFGRLYTSDEQFKEMTRPKLFQFDQLSEYKALKKGSEQWDSVEQYEAHKDIPVYYLLYNPLNVPCSISVPHAAAVASHVNNDAGCRVIPCKHVRKLMETAVEDSTPSYQSLATGLPAPFDEPAHRTGWRLEHFVVDLLLQCKTGRVTDIRNDPGLYRAFYRRTAPIRAAIAITIDAPGGFDWEVEPELQW